VTGGDVIKGRLMQRQSASGAISIGLQLAGRQRDHIPSVTSRANGSTSAAVLSSHIKSISKGTY